MTSDACEFCSGDLTVVEGILGPQLFCQACRRFQPQSEPQFHVRAAEKGKPVAEREEEDSERSKTPGR